MRCASGLAAFLAAFSLSGNLAAQQDDASEFPYWQAVRNYARTWDAGCFADDFPQKNSFADLQRRHPVVAADDLVRCLIYVFQKEPAGHDGNGTRIGVLGMLGHSGMDRANTFLMQVAADRSGDRDVRDCAMGDLALAHCPAALPLLRTILEDSSDFPANLDAADVLGRMGTEEDIARLEAYGKRYPQYLHIVTFSLEHIRKRLNAEHGARGPEKSLRVPLSDENAGQSSGPGPDKKKGPPPGPQATRTTRPPPLPTPSAPSRTSPAESPSGTTRWLASLAAGAAALAMIYAAWRLRRRS